MDYKKIPYYMTHPISIIGWLCWHGHLRWLPDEAALKAEYRMVMHKKLDLKEPRTFGEKIQWRKLHDRKPEYIKMVDKYAAKTWIAEHVGEKYIIPTLGVWDCFDDIDFDSLPDRFILKCTHDSGSVIRVKNKGRLDRIAARKKLEKALRRNWFYVAREWAYKDVPPRIIAEEYLEDDNGTSDSALTDYKFYCFSGVPLYCQVVTSRGVDERIDFFDMDWVHQEFTGLGIPAYPFSDSEPMCPAAFEEMKRTAARLSEGSAFLRVDLYEVNGRVYVGELTFYPAAGMGAFVPEKWDRILAEKLTMGGGNLRLIIYEPEKAQTGYVIVSLLYNITTIEAANFAPYVNNRPPGRMGCPL